ncbi:MAG: EAL domain-containing protein [Novosphingobium sp.]
MSVETGTQERNAAHAPPRVPSAAAPSAAAYVPNRVFHIPGYWAFIAPVMAAGLVPAYASARALPVAAAVLAVLVAMLIGVSAKVFARLERETARNAGQRAVVMLLGVGLPMLLYGAAAANWARQQGEPFWIGAVGMAGLAATAASLLLARRSPAMLTALAAVWLPLVAGAGAWQGWCILAIGTVGGTLMAWRQMVSYRQAMARRQEQQRVHQRAFDILVDYERTGQGWFWETDASGRITYLSPSLGDVFGCPVEALRGRPFVELFGDDITGHESAATSLNFHFSARAGFRDIVVSVAAEGKERWWSISGSPILDGCGAYLGFRGFGWDQSERRRSQERSSRLAHYDSLTGAANRLQMSQSLETILNAPDEAQRKCAVLLIDLDRFKQVNDTLGHPAGDDVLKQVAERLRGAVGGMGRIGRIGGDEFQVILPGAHEREVLGELAGTILSSLSQVYPLDDKRAVIGASVGIALAPDDGVTSQALIRNADLALYAAKKAGRGLYRFYVPDLHGDAEERRQLERDLREAVATGGLELWYQPIVHTVSETITGFEALLRWTHPRLGTLSPARFVPLAEEAGLIAPIGEWALRTACRDLANWPESVSVAVNLSPLQFANPALPAIVTSALASAQVAPSRLELEITERVFLSEDTSTEATFAALKRIGVRLALDDFGTGYASIGYLDTAPFDRIKIDQSLLRGATAPGSRNGPILASIVGLGEALDMETTAEGVETLEELELVRALGCSHVQGYIYEPPMPLADAVARLARGLDAGTAGSHALRAPRNAILRKIVLEADGERHEALVRNITVSGAMVEAPGPVQPGASVTVHVEEGQAIPATVRWRDGDRIGVQFAAPLVIDTPRRMRPPVPAIAAPPAGDAPDIRRATR